MDGVLSSIKLSRQEEQVLLLSMSGLGDREVGEAMGLSTETVRTYWKRIRKKVNGGTRAEIIALLSQRGVRAELEAKETENEQLLFEIARRKQAEAQLQYQLSLIRSITDGAADAIFLLGPDGRVSFANPAATEIFGWTLDELEGKVFHEVFHHHYPDGKPYPIGECPLQLVFRSETTVRNHEDQFYRKDGRAVSVSCSNAPVRDGDRKLGAVLIVRDMTEEKKAMQALQRSELRYRSLFENTLNPIVLVDRDSVCLEANRGLTRVLGYAYDDVVGKKLSRSLLKSCWPEIVAAVESGGIFEGTVPVRFARGGTATCYALAQPDRGGPDAYVWVTLRPER